MDYKNFFQSGLFRKTLSIVGVVIVALLVFQVGIFVGYHKAEFSYRLGDNYYRTFDAPSRRHGIMGRFMPGEFSEAHGVVGKVIKIASPTIVIEGNDRIEKVVRVTDATQIRRFRDSIKLTDLKEGDIVVVFGGPNEQSEIEAHLIRLLPPSPSAHATSTRPI